MWLLDFFLVKYTIPEYQPKCFGESTDHFNFHFVSCLPLLGKVLETLVISEFVKYLCSQGLLSDNQYGFRFTWSNINLSKGSTSLDVVAIFNTRMNGEACAFVLNISKVFDSVSYALFHKIIIAILDNFWTDLEKNIALHIF